MKHYGSTIYCKQVELYEVEFFVLEIVRAVLNALLKAALPNCAGQIDLFYISRASRIFFMAKGLTGE